MIAANQKTKELQMVSPSLSYQYFYLRHIHYSSKKR